MKTAILYGGQQGAGVFKGIAEGGLSRLGLQVAAVVCLDPELPGVNLAQKRGWPILSCTRAAMALPGLEIVLELVGDAQFLTELYRCVPSGVRVMDLRLAGTLMYQESIYSASREEIDRQTTLDRLVRHETEQLQQILDFLPDAVMVINRERRLERVNARFMELVDVQPEDLAKPCSEINPFCVLHGGCQDGQLACAFDELEKTGQPVQFIHLDPRPDGTERYFRIIQNPLFDEQGRVEKVIETARVITKQVQRYRHAEENAQLFRQLVDSAHDMITIKDFAGRYLVINPPAAELIGHKPEECLGKTDQELLPERLAQVLSVKDKQTIESRQHTSPEEVLVIDGGKRYLNTVRFPLWDYKGEISGVCSISRDFTERHRLQEAVIQSEKLAAVGKLAASVAHELNNPLTGILTFAEELKLDAKPGDPLFPDYEIIAREAMRCRQIVADLLDYSKIRKPRRKSMDINQAIERALSIVHRQALFKDMSFNLELTPNLPPLELDSAQMQQVFLNLIINAAEA
ncbi:MAG: PAS domain-containing protein, partial [Desulfarculaceae bacterium]